MPKGLQRKGKKHHFMQSGFLTPSFLNGTGSTSRKSSSLILTNALYTANISEPQPFFPESHQLPPVWPGARQHNAASQCGTVCPNANLLKEQTAKACEFTSSHQASASQELFPLLPRAMKRHLEETDNSAANFPLPQGSKEPPATPQM